MGTFRSSDLMNTASDRAAWRDAHFSLIDRLLGGMQPMGAGGFGFGLTDIDDRWDGVDDRVPVAVRYAAYHRNHWQLVGEGSSIGGALRDLVLKIEAAMDADAADTALGEFWHEVWEAQKCVSADGKAGGAP
jgi:hypothetical protein